MAETLIVVPLDPSGTVDTAHGVCLPAPQGATASFVERLARNNGIPPYEWPSVCGRVGIVYNHGGSFEDVPLCDRCVNPAPVPAPEPREELRGRGRARLGRWDRDAILEAARRWHGVHGQPPSQTSWKRSGEWWPTASHATKTFGSWSAFIRATGFEPVPVGRPRIWHPHGDERRYFQGCRQDCCRIAHREAARARAQAKAA